MKDSYLFISDIHLGLRSREIESKKERLLVKFLELAKNEAKELFIVGDLFDYWFEYKRVYQKGYFRTLTALQDITEAGVKIHYFIGNHDFMHGDFFEKEIGAAMYDDPIERVLNGKRFFIGHGDGMVKNDTGYNILKKIMRNKTLQTLYSWVHPDIGISIASGTSKSSREYTSKKNYGEIDGLYDAARSKIDEGFDYVIFGHLHKRQFVQYKNGTYINLGSWLDAPCYGIFRGSKFEIVEWK
ncbi:MAG TPA: UDP-2,3-diacylglucosamine diphosphatase [Ignavibacteriaceae bacterium]|nr:UDP-2,3-diacylglucosamine diphosphatase [Ignavibacteriaceae bacterium]